MKTSAPVLGSENPPGQQTRVYGETVWVFKFCQLPEGEKVDIVGRVDGLRNAKDAVSHRDSAAKDRVVLHVVDTGAVDLPSEPPVCVGCVGGQWAGGTGRLQEGCGVQHCNHIRYRVQDIVGDLKPLVESGDQLFSNVLARIGHEIVVWPEKDLNAVSLVLSHQDRGRILSSLFFLVCPL